jgi:hypothetical protein
MDLNGEAAPLRKAPMATDNSIVINGHCLSQMPKGDSDPVSFVSYLIINKFGLKPQ